LIGLNKIELRSLGKEGVWERKEGVWGVGVRIGFGVWVRI